MSTPASLTQPSETSTPSDVSKPIAPGFDRLLIDAEVYLYRCAEAATHEIEWEPDVWRLECRLKDAKASFSDQISEFCKQINLYENDVLLCFGEGESFRHRVYPLYKSHRKKYRKPPGYKALIEWAKSQWHHASIPGLEGDDVIGVLARYGDIVCSIDKDLKQVPGYHLIDGKLDYISPFDAKTLLLTQWLTGDPADGYPGCHGIGIKSAEKILAAHTLGDREACVFKAYEKAGLTREEAMVQYHCAKILRPEDLAHRLAFKEAPFDDRP